MAAVRYHGFVMRVLGPLTAFGGLYHCAKVGCNRCSGFDNMHVFRFREFGLKTLIHAPKCFLVWSLTPKWKAKTQKFEPSCVKIRRRV